MRKSTWLLLSGIVVVGLVTGVEVQRGVNSAKHLTSVVVVVKDVAPFQQITSNDVAVESRSLVNVSQTPLKDKSKVVGSYTRVGLVAGQMVFPSALSNESPLLNLPVSERDITVPLNRTDFGIKDLHPGMHVDLVGVAQATGSGTTSGMIASDVEIMQVVAQNSSSPDEIVVAVPIDKAAAVTQAALNGNLRIDLVPEG